MTSLGHGISDAVRNHIPIWVDDTIVNVLYEAYKGSGGILSKEGTGGFRKRVKESKDWVRKSRRTTDTGFERMYRCKTVQKATLIVHSPPGDMSANAYVFCIDDKPIAGGKTKLKSTHVSTQISKTDKTTSKSEDTVFVKFSEEELSAMRVRMEFGDGFDRLELDREA